MTLADSGLPAHVIEQLRDVFAAWPSIHAVLLYGSRAKGNHRPGSDIDLAIDAPELTLSELHSIENRIDDLLLPWTVDLSLLHLIDNPSLLDHIARVGVPLHDRRAR